MKYARHRSREIAVQTLYPWLLTQTPLRQTSTYMQSLPDFKQADAEFFNTIISGIESDIANLNQILEMGLDRPISKLSSIEHAILLIGAYELEKCEDTPFKVVIDEAIKLTKTFGNPDGFRFVNGVLDKVANKLREKEMVEPNNKLSITKL